MVVLIAFRWRDGVVLDRSMSPAACAYVEVKPCVWRLKDTKCGGGSITCLFPSVVRLADGVATKDGKVSLLGADFAIPA